MTPLLGAAFFVGVILSFSAADAPDGAEDGEESPAEAADVRSPVISRGFFAVLDPYRGVDGSE
jgi:hypothetical protein